MDPEVNKPDHYDGDACLRFIETYLAEGKYRAGDAFCIGNAIKYLWRAGRKPGIKAEKDLAKAKWYIARYWEGEHDEDTPKAFRREQLNHTFTTIQSAVERAKAGT